jgi:hypothetical protein
MEVAAMARKRKSEGNVKSPDPFVALYPHIAAWVQDGWIEVGRDDCNRSFVRALDIGGLIWEGAASYPSLHDALLALDAGVAGWLKENG